MAQFHTMFFGPNANHALWRQLIRTLVYTDSIFRKDVHYETEAQFQHDSL